MPDPPSTPVAAEAAPAHGSPARKWLLATLVYWIALFVGTHLPPTAVTEVASLYDKPIHMGAYFGLTLLLIGTLRRAFRPSLAATYGLAVGLALALAAVDELTQPLANRICDPWDWAADGAGAVAAVAVDGLRRRLAS